MKPDGRASPRAKVAFGSGVPPAEKPVQQLLDSTGSSHTISVFSDGAHPKPPEEPRRQEAASATASPLGQVAPGQPSRSPISPASARRGRRGSTSPTEEPTFHAQTKITYSHIGSGGSEDDIRRRLRETLSASSIRIEPENAQEGLSEVEIRLLVEEISKVGPGSQVPCHNLTLGRCGLDDNDAEKLGNALGRNRQLEVLNLWNNKISTRGGEGLGYGLASNSTLKTLSLRSNDLGPKGALGVAKGLMHNKSLTYLSMRYNWIGDDGAKACSALLLSNNRIRELDVSRNRIGSEGALAIMKALWHNCALTGLNLQLNQICDKGGLYIGSALSHNTTLKTLDIMDCVVADSGCVSIFQALGAAAKETELMQETKLRRKKTTGANHVLQVLVASGNEIGDIGTLTIGQALKVNQGLVKLDLSRNRLMDQGATALAGAIERNKVLRELNLSKNKMGDEGLKRIADAVRSNDALMLLDVSQNLATFKANISGIVENESLKTFRSDLNLQRAELATADGLVRGFQQNVSNAHENGLVQRPLQIFQNLSSKLVSLHSLENRLGQESPTDFVPTLGEFTHRATQLLDLSLARNNLKCEHVKLLCFTSLVFLDLSQNAIGNAGMEYLITSFAKVKPGPRIRELDLTDNTIYKVPPVLAHITSLECLFLEGNPAIRMVALSAIQGGIKSVTQWLMKWAHMQLDLADIAKGIVKNKQAATEPTPSESPTSTSPVGMRPKTSTRKNIGCCSEYPAVYPPTPCCAVFGNAERFPTKQVEPTPGPADASPWVHRKEGETYQRIVFEENWRSAVSTQPKSYRGGAPIAVVLDLNDEQERAVLEVRNQLIDESFQGRSALPSNWNHPRHPIVVETGRETKILSKMNVVKPPGFQEKYGIKSIISRMKQLYPRWEICEVQITRVLKKHSVLHSDNRHFFSRPTLLGTAGDMPPEPGAVPYVPPHAEQEDWKSRVQFVKCFNAIFDGKKYQGFSQFMMKIVKQGTHEKVMALARQYFHRQEFHGKPIWDHTNKHEAGRRVRDFIQEVYIEPFKVGYYDDENFIKNATTVLKRDPMRGDDISFKIESHRIMSLFQHSDPPPHRPRESWLDASLKEAADLADVGPGSYEPDRYGAVGCDPYAGKSISLPIESPPNTVPGPGAYTPQESCADKKIPPHYIKPVGGTILAPPMQELVLCQPALVHEAKHWLETAAPSNGLQVQLLKQRDWLDTYEVGTPQRRPPKSARKPSSRQEFKQDEMTKHGEDIEESSTPEDDGNPACDEQEPARRRTTIPPGFKWKEIGPNEPEIGTQIFSESLSTALREKLEFTQAELDTFQVPELSYTSYIRVEKMYFRPEAFLYGKSRQKWLNELYDLGVTKQRARNEGEETHPAMERPFTSGTSTNRQHIYDAGPGSEKRVFLVIGSKDDLERVLGDKEEMARVGLERLGNGPWPLQEGAGPAYNVPSTFDPKNRLFSSPTRVGHVQTRDWLHYRSDAERSRNPGPGSFEHTTTDRTGKWDAPIERLTSGLPQSKACQGSFAYTMGLPRKMLPHMDPLSSARITPSVQTYESFTLDKTGKAITFLETCLSGVKAPPTPRIAQKTPYTGGDLMFTRDPNNGVPGVGSYEAEPLTGSANLISKPSVPGYSIGHDTHRRASADVTHIPVAGLGMIGTNTDFAQRPQTIEARVHSSCITVDGKTHLKSPRGGARSRSQSPVIGYTNSLRPAHSRGAEVYTMPKTPLRTSTRLRPRPPESPPTRKLSTLMNMDPDVPGMQTYTITHTIGYDKNPIVRNAPKYTVPIDYEHRGEPMIYNCVDKDFAVSVVTPRLERTARARVHDTQKDWTDAQSFSPRALRGRHFAPRTSKSFLHPPKKQPAADDLALMKPTRGGKTRGGGGKSGNVGMLRMPPKTARI